MTKLTKILLSQNSLAKVLGFNIFLKAIHFDHHIEIVKNIKAESVLVLAPHPDDDVFGAGGTIEKLLKNNTKVTVVYFCDGALGGDVKTRKNEAIESAKILGSIDQRFFGCLDGKLASGPEIINKLLDLIKESKADIIFLPSFLDNHPDHKMVNEILINALGNIDIKVKEIWTYDIWTPISPNRIIDISDNIEIKKKAIAAHKSQLKPIRYDKAIISLNQYRAEINGIAGFAEGFFATTPEIYKKLYRNN